ncbi:MAG: MFS transporter [Candidatus Eisenbacteria bacterium]
MTENPRKRILAGDRLPPLLPVLLFLELVSLGATIPSLPYFTRALGGSAFHVTLCFFLTAAPKILFQPMWGAWSDRIGRRPVMILSQIGSLLSYLAWAIAPSLRWLLFSRALYGLFGAQLTVAGSIVADRLPPEERARGMGILGAISGLGFVIGPIAGGIVAARVGYSAIGWAGVAVEAAAIALAVALPETSPRRAARRRPSHAGSTFRRALAHPAVGPLLLVVLVGTTGFSVVQGTLVVLAEDRWGYGVQQMGKMLGLFFLIAAFIQGFGLRPLVPRFGERNLARAGYLLIAIGLAVLVPEAPGAALWISLLLLAGGAALTTPAPTALLSRATHEEDQGRVQGLNQGMTGLGRSVSGATMGGLYDRFGMGTPFGVSALLVVIALALLLLPGGEREPLFRSAAAPPVPPVSPAPHP